jgi:hypothetical protein
MLKEKSFTNIKVLNYTFEGIIILHPTTEILYKIVFQQKYEV